MKKLDLTKRILTAVLASALLMMCFGCTEKAGESTDTEKSPENTVTEKAPESSQTTEDSCTRSPSGVVGTDENGKEITSAKPVIYLYPERETSVSVKLTYDGKLTATYPAYGDGWENITAFPDGRLEYNGREYYCLYWEGVTDKLPSAISAGACVRGEDTAEYLERALAELGLTEREANEFIIYWLPQLENNEYNLISFIGEEYTDIAKLDISPAPDSVLRVYMLASPSGEYVQLAPQSFTPFERKGFCVVEWGGSIIE